MSFRWGFLALLWKQKSRQADQDQLLCCFGILPKQEGFVLTQLVLNLSSLVAKTDGGRLSGAQPVLGVFQSQTC